MAKETKYLHVSMRLDEMAEVWKSIKIYCVKNDIDLKDFTAAALKEYCLKNGVGIGGSND